MSFYLCDTPKSSEAPQGVKTLFTEIARRKIYKTLGVLGVFWEAVGRYSGIQSLVWLVGEKSNTVFKI